MWFHGEGVGEEWGRGGVVERGGGERWGLEGGTGPATFRDSQARLLATTNDPLA